MATSGDSSCSKVSQGNLGRVNIILGDSGRCIAISGDSSCFKESQGNLGCVNVIFW